MFSSSQVHFHFKIYPIATEILFEINFKTILVQYVVDKMASNGSSSMDHLQEALESFIEKLRVIGVIAGDYQLENAAIFKDKIRELTDSMHEISGLQAELVDVNIPLEVVEHVDKGGNPELYTQKCLQETLDKCTAMKAKQKAYKEFREQLMQKLSQAFPEVIQQYKSSHSQGLSS